jgi:hypothetical protein
MRDERLRHRSDHSSEAKHSYTTDGRKASQVDHQRVDGVLNCANQQSVHSSQREYFIGLDRTAQSCVKDTNRVRSELATTTLPSIINGHAERAAADPD